MLMKEIVRKDVFKVVWRGMDGVLFRQLLVDAIEATARKHGIGIEVMRPFGGMPVEFADVIQTLGQTLDQRCVAVTMIHARVWHWTVITKATKKSILLFDSSGLSLVRMKNCGLRNTDSRYRINARELLFLRRAERE
jgi:hypothetical protein